MTDSPGTRGDALAVLRAAARELMPRASEEAVHRDYFVLV